MIFAPNIRREARVMLFQSTLAGLSILILAFALNVSVNAVLVASLGATAFTVFTIPNAISARQRAVIGGHGIGIFAGFTATLIIQQLPGLELLGYAAAIGLSSIFMDITETEHPPAAGTALGIALTGFSLEAAVTVIGGAIGLSFSHRILRRWLKDIIR